MAKYKIAENNNISIHRNNNIFGPEISIWDTNGQILFLNKEDFELILNSFNKILLNDIFNQENHLKPLEK